MNLISFKFNSHKKFKEILFQFSFLYVINLFYYIFMYYWSNKNENDTAMISMFPWVGIVFVIVALALYQKLFEDVGFKYYFQSYVFLTIVYYGVLRLLVMAVNMIFFSDVYFWGEGTGSVVGTLVEIFDVISFIFIIYSAFYLLALWVKSTKFFKKQP